MKKSFFFTTIWLFTIAGGYAQQLKVSTNAKENTNRPNTEQSIAISREKLPTPWKTYPKDAPRSQLSRREIIGATTDPVNYPDYIPIASHRAQMAGVNVPENSRPGIDSVIRRGYAEILELDIKTTKDRITYLMHDSFLQRTTNFLSVYPGNVESMGPDYGRFSNLTWEETKRLFLLNPDNTPTNEHPPLFVDVLKYVRDFSTLLINLDINDPNVFSDVWDVVVKEKAFDCVIFKGSTLRAKDFKALYYDRLSADDKTKLMYFPLLWSPPKDKTITLDQYYQEWEDSGMAKGYEGNFRTSTTDPDQKALAVVKKIRDKKRVKVHTFSTLPMYLGRPAGDRPTHQCCIVVVDARGDVEFLLDPFNKKNMNEGVDGYIIYDDPKGLHNALTQLGKRQLPKPPAGEQR